MYILKNTFITHEGLVLKNFKLVPNSHFNLKGTKDQTFYWNFWKLAFEQYVVSTYGKSLKKIELIDHNYLHIYTKWFGYFFWLTDALVKLIKTEHLQQEMILLYPVGWKNINYVNQTLALFPKLKTQEIPLGTHMQVESLYLPKTRKWSGIVPVEDLKLIKAFILKHIENRSIHQKFGERIYISREKANRRKPINENELNEVLDNYNFKRVCLEDYTILDQLAIIHQAKIVIGLHGAGLANCLMMEEISTLIELAPQVRTKKELRTSFQQLAKNVSLHYHVIFNPVTIQNEADIYDNNITVDLKQLKSKLNTVLKK